MIGPNGKKWPIKYGWHAHFQNSKGYFIIGWITFVVDNELKVENKLFFIITSPFSIIVKVLGMVEAMLSANDKADENDFENDIKEEYIINDENYKEKDEKDKDEDDVDDDDDKVVRLASKNEKHSYQDDDSMVLISFDENENDKELPKN
jgi:hypothetical protein